MENLNVNLVELSQNEINEVSGGSLLGWTVGFVVGCLDIIGQVERRLNQSGVPGGHAMMQ